MQGDDYMTNQEYLKWEPMLKKIAYKYKNNKFGLEVDDLMQIAILGFIRAFKTYEKDYGTSELNYYYTCAEREILKEFESLGRAKRFCINSISLNAPINNSNDDIYMDEIIPDTTINVEAMALDILIIKSYIDEINKVLPDNQRDVVLLKIFDDKTDQEIADILEIKKNKVSKIYLTAKNKLVQKSNLIRLKYFELQRSKVNNWKSINWDRDIYYETEIENLKRAIRRENKEKTHELYGLCF